MPLPERYQTLLGYCVDSLQTCIQLTHEYMNGDDQIVQDDIIKEITKQYCDIDFEVKKEDNAVVKVQQYLSENSRTPNGDIDKLYKKFLDEDTSCSNYLVSKIFNEVFLNQEEVTEVLKKNKEHAIEEAYEVLNDSIQCSSVFTPPVDPLCKKIIENPYKNRFCGHLFEYKLIINYIKERRNKARCPYMGCNNTNFRACDLKADPVLKQRIADYLATHETSSDENE